MRKVQFFFDNDPDNLMKRVNEFFEKLERSGFRVISTSYSRGMYNSCAAFIDYETKSEKSK